MARAVFQKGQRVFVKPLGAWAEVVRIVPQWVRGVEEPLRVQYDVGMGREFTAAELAHDVRAAPEDDGAEHWRLVRLANRWHSEAEGMRRNHPFPGTYPVVMTEEMDWGGWRTPTAEYERNPERIEHQARIIANALRMLRLARRLSDAAAAANGGDPALRALGEEADAILRDVYDAHLDPPIEPETPAALLA